MKIDLEPSSSLLTKCQTQNQVSPGIQPEDTNRKPRETHTEEEKGSRERKQKLIANLVGQLEAMSEYVKERGGTPLQAEVHKARSLIGQLGRLGYRPRKIGLSMRQLGLNPKAAKARPTPMTYQIEEWQAWLGTCRLYSGCLSAWELDFITDIGKRLERGQGLTDKQAECLWRVSGKARQARHG